MAALDASQAVPLFQQPTIDPVTCALYAIKGVATADTLDLSGPFRRLFSAGFVDLTVAPIAQSAPTLSGTGSTTVTFAAAGMTNDAGYLLVVGVPR